MKVIFIILAIVTLLPLIVGLFLPAKRSFEKNAQFKSTPQQIWDVITDIKGQEEWRNDIKSIQIINDKKGAEKWTEIPKKGQAITFQVKTFQPPNRYDIEIVDSSISGYWEGRINDMDGKTQINFKEIVLVRNPYFRVFAYLFVDLNETMEVYLLNLKNKLGENG